MRIERTNITEKTPSFFIGTKVRNYLLATLAAAGVSVAACSDDSPTLVSDDETSTESTGGTGGETGGTGGETSETGGEGGESTGGTGGETGEDPCEDLQFEGLASKRFDPGEVGSFEVSLDASHPDAAYNTTRFEMVSGDIVIQPSLIGLRKVVKDNHQTGYSTVGDLDGIRPIVIDADQHYIEDGQGGCELNLVSVNTMELSDPAKQPMMDAPNGVFATVFEEKNGGETLAAYTLTADRTRFALSNLTTLDDTTEVFMTNSKPVVAASAHRELDGHIVANLAGTTDESDGSDNVLGKLNLAAQGVIFSPVPGQPGTFRSNNPSNLTSLDMLVAGLNEGMVDDTSMQTVQVTETDPCIGVDCNGNGTCNGGDCVCDAGYVNDDADPQDDCDSCDVGYVGYPNCEPDPCLNVECNGNGTCENGACNCDPGYANDDMNAADDCDSCDVGYVGYPNCQPDPCVGVDCNGNGSCVNGACVCDTGYENDDADPQDDCDDCEPGYIGYPNCQPDPCVGVNCNGNGTCVNGACVCDAGFDNDDANPNDDCDDCDTESGLYENDYPVCSPDTTPPNAPVITTNGGSNMIINQANYVLEGNTDADTWTMWYNIDGGPFNQIGGYPSNSINWLYNGNIPAVFQDDNACFQARDKAGNQSATDCITVSRVQ